MSTVSSPASRRQSRLLATATAEGTGERSLESLALGVGAVAFIVTGLAALIVFRFDDAPIAGPGSLGQFAAIAAAVIAILAFVAGRLVVREGGRMGLLDVVDIAALSFAHAIIALLTWTLLADILERGFIGAEVFAFPVIILAGAIAAVTAYIVFYSATHMDLELLAVVLAVFLAEGVIASMLTASDPYWWKDNLSALGMNDDLSSKTFNLTLIVAGIIVTTLARYATAGIPTPDPKGVGRVRACLIVVGVFLGLVGVFPVDRFFAIHTGVASGMVVAFAVLIFNLHRWIPGMPRAFVLLGWLFVAVIVVLAVFFAVGYYTLTAVELVAGILVFTWIILFIRNASALQQDTER
ncbi:DUF998 domain-containing protein [Planococcus sp. APC 4015]|nr:DUF998 domain-containing protein [Planococcus sp. APC 4015]